MATRRVRRAWLLLAAAVFMLATAIGCFRAGPTGAAHQPLMTPAPLYAPSPLNVEVTLDEGRAVTRHIPVDGGTLEATAQDGTRYTLAVPAGALLAGTSVTMTPITAVHGAPVRGGRVAGVDLAPDGLRLYEHATLTITPAGLTGPVSALGFSYKGEGEDFHLFPLERDPSVLSMKLLHFSGELAFVDTGEGTQLTVPPDTFMPTDWESQISHWLAELMQAEREAQLRGEPGNPEFPEMVEAGLREFYNMVIGPLLPGIAGDCGAFQALNGKVIGWDRTVQLMGMGDTFSRESGAITDAVAAGADNCWKEETKDCIDQSDAEQMERVTSVARLNLMLGGDESKYNPMDPALQCGCIDVSNIEAWEGFVTLTFEDSVTEQQTNSPRTVTERHSFQVEYRVERPDVPLPRDAQGRVLSVRYFGSATSGTINLEGRIDYSGGSSTSVTANGPITLGTGEITVRPLPCSYQLFLGVSVDGRHQPSGNPWTAAGGHVRVTAPLPSGRGGGVPVLSGTMSIPAYTAGPEQPGANAYLIRGFGAGNIAQIRRTQQLANAQVTWSFWPEGTRPPEITPEPTPRSPFSAS